MIYTFHFEWFSEGDPNADDEEDREDIWVANTYSRSVKNNRKFDADDFMEWQMKVMASNDAVFGHEWRFTHEEIT